jgi:hypothetical protein
VSYEHLEPVLDRFQAAVPFGVVVFQDLDPVYSLLIVHFQVVEHHLNVFLLVLDLLHPVLEPPQRPFNPAELRLERTVFWVEGLAFCERPLQSPHPALQLLGPIQFGVPPIIIGICG